jgi:hypothetical protein
MELQIFIEREIAADPFFILPSSVPNLIVASYVPIPGSKTCGLESRFKNGGVILSK